MRENKKDFIPFIFYNFVALDCATATLNNIKIVSLAVEGVDICLFH